MQNPTIPTASRRELLAGLAGLAGVAVVATAPAVVAAVSSDPVFAALAANGKAYAVWDAINDRKSALEREGLDVTEVEEEERELFEDWLETERAVMTTEPTTRAGALALLRFVAENFDELADGAEAEVPGAIRAALRILEREEERTA